MDDLPRISVPHGGWPGVNAIGRIPRMLNHVAYVTHDAQATVDFYTGVLGMELVSTVIDDAIPSTGDPFPYFHLFFRMADGSTIAFFESPGLPPAAPLSHPAYDIFNHIALQVDSREDIAAWHAWLKEQDVDVIGPVDHKGLILSIYFRDPNGLRLELTTPLDADWNRHIDQARVDLQAWNLCKRRAAEQGRPVREVLIEHIRETRKRYDAVHE